MTNITSRLADNKSNATLRRSLFLKQMIKSWVNEIIMLPLAALDLIGSFYSSLLKLIKVNVANLWADKVISARTGEILEIQGVRLKPGGRHVFPIKVDQLQKGRIVIVSHLVMARPLVFRINNHKLDVFHG